MYSGVPHIVDIYNDSDDIQAFSGIEDNEQYVYLKCRIKKPLGVDSQGILYAHLTDGVQHMRLEVRPAPVADKGKGKK